MGKMFGHSSPVVSLFCWGKRFEGINVFFPFKQLVGGISWRVIDQVIFLLPPEIMVCNDPVNLYIYI